MSFRIIYFLFLLLGISFNVCPDTVYEVSPDGLGLKSLKGASEDISVKLNSHADGEFTVILDEGIYYLDEPLLFDENNSFSSGLHHITYTAKEGANPIISGGVKLSSWTFDENRNDVIKTSVDSDVRNLWVNDVRMRRADGYIGYATRIFDEKIDGKEVRGLLFPKDDLPLFHDISGLEIRYYRNWRSYCFKVESIQDYTSNSSIPEDQVLIVLRNFDVALSQTPKMDWIGVGKDNPYYFENSIDLLDEPGEWCYTPSDNTLYYYLKDDENLDNIEAVVPRLENLLSVKSSSREKKVKNLVFSGLEFSHCDWDWPKQNGFIDHQSSVYYTSVGQRDIIPTAIKVEDARNVKFESCKFTRLSSNGVQIKNNTDSIVVENCDFKDISGAAVSISDYNHKELSDTVLPVKNNLISNNLISEVGIEYASCAAIEAYYAEDLTISHNELYDCPYTGISVGWGWTMDATSQKNVRILNNKIIGDTQKCFDGGAIYSLSHFGGDGLIIEGNYIDETVHKPAASTQGAIYTDQGSSNIHINNNVVLSDRNWFFYHQPGTVEVDSVFVLPENLKNYGGIDALSGGTEVTYLQNGEHIFCLPHETADSIRRNAGRITKYDDGTSDVIACNITSYTLSPPYFMCKEL